jgi:pyruvate,water dikinase
MTANAPNRAFANPYDVKPPEGCADYAEMYPYYLRFNESLRTGDEDRFWFFNGMHFPEPVFPFDIITADSPYMALGQINTRIFAVPPALGIEHRVLNGYVYISSNSVLDPEEIGRRAQLFLPRAGYYYRNWDDLYARWIVKVEAAIRELSALEVPQLEEFEPESVVMDGVGFGSTYQLMVAYNRLLESIDLVWQYHFEFLNLGYAAYLTFTQVCRQHFPDITDQSMARMVGGVEVTTFRPDEELKKAARDRQPGGGRRHPRGPRSAGCNRCSRPRLDGSAALGDGPVVLLLVRQRLLPPPSQLDRRPTPPRGDDRLLRAPPHCGRGHRPPGR